MTCVPAAMPVRASDRLAVAFPRWYCTLAMPVEPPAPSVVPSRASALLPLLPTATASCVLPFTPRVLPAIVLKPGTKGAVPRESASMPVTMFDAVADTGAAWLICRLEIVSAPSAETFRLPVAPLLPPVRLATGEPTRPSVFASSEMRWLTSLP